MIVNLCLWKQNDDSRGMMAGWNDCAIADALQALARTMGNHNRGGVAGDVEYQGNKKEMEFLELKHGNMTVAEYAAKFEELKGHIQRDCLYPKKERNGVGLNDQTGCSKATGRVFTLNGDEASKSKDLIQEKLKLSVSSLNKDPVVETPTSGSVLTSNMCLNCPMEISSRTFLIDLICLPLIQIDVILVETNVSMGDLPVVRVFPKVFPEDISGLPPEKERVFCRPVMQSYPQRTLDRRLQEDWAKDAREGPRILMSLRLLGDIREGQKIDRFLRTQLEAIESGRDSSFIVGSDEVLRLQDRICVPNVPELRKMILEEGHRSNLSIHPGATKMYQDLKMMFWWPNKKREVKLIQEKMRTAESRQKNYQDKRRKDLEFKVSDHVFLRLGLVEHFLSGDIVATRRVVTFGTLNLSHQLRVEPPRLTYGEVTRSFSMRWKDMVERYWHLVDKNGNMHTIVYNQDLDGPTIVLG
ncbi:hypothetical protein D0Y65_015449 [Glycine soja]|uniref:Integrase zinc-binding domain-containing protein n=1 Tax=Glycine soja TaxID=3848 RepID=A0A445KDE8_GLYSO|nr:hypothetical protein D0Y65_015449 [Glycine soja]